MKKLLMLLLTAALCLSAGSAAEWAAGRSAARPYVGLPEVDLGTHMGYVMMYPNAKLPAQRYCDTLTICLPREDVALGSGALSLCDASGVLARVPFDDADAVTLRRLTEEELDDLLWGSGVCIEVRLPMSLPFGTDCYVLMEEGCFTAADGAVASIAVTAVSAWIPEVGGDYGVGGVRYTAEGSDQAKAAPGAGDTVRFEVILGGEAASAVVYSGNGSVQVDAAEYTESAAVTGRVLSDEVDWGVVFLDANGAVLDNISLTR